RHGRHQPGRHRAHQPSARGPGRPAGRKRVAPGAAQRRGSVKVKKKELPPGLHRDTLAVRAALEPSQYGENSEALFLTSGFIQPDSETMAHRFANPQDGYTYGRTSNPTVT